MIHTMKELCKRYHVNDIKTHVFTKEEYDYINSHIIRYLYTSSNCRYEEFIKLIPEVCDLNSSVDKDESIYQRKMYMFNNYKEFIKEYYKIFYGSPNVLGNELICNLLSILKL